MRSSWVFIILAIFGYRAIAQSKANFNYTVSTPSPKSHVYHVEFYGSGWTSDTITFKMPRWTPGYYQIMNYAAAVENFTARDDHQNFLPFKKLNDNTWQVVYIKNKSISLSYDVRTEKQFVANSYLDSIHGYLIPAGVFLYADHYLNSAVRVSIRLNPKWNMATGLKAIGQNEFFAPDFDVLYDCPILMGNLETLPPFSIRGIPHRFIGFKMGEFDRLKFMENLGKITSSATNIIGDVPFDEYTFIGIGPGRGGIEHLNNTTVSFDGKGLETVQGMNRMMNFLAHEYFHHYNVKRIRPFELGLFDYDKGSRTNLLWVSEGLSVYYEYLIVRRAGLADDQLLFSSFEKNLNAHENNPGRSYQSLTQASYKTWSDGPFGTSGEDPKKSISYYDKGPLVGMILDFAIRHHTQNKKSLDDVMRQLYWHYYKEMGRGFTDAEFEQTCESVAGVSLSDIFEYVYSTRELDYATYFGFAGLGLEVKNDSKEKKYFIHRIQNAGALESAILKSWLGN